MISLLLWCLSFPYTFPGPSLSHRVVSVAPRASAVGVVVVFIPATECSCCLGTLLRAGDLLSHLDFVSGRKAQGSGDWILTSGAVTI